MKWFFQWLMVAWNMKICLDGYWSINNQQAGGLIMRLPAAFYACKCRFSRGVQPPLQTGTDPSKFL